MTASARVPLEVGDRIAKEYGAYTRVYRVVGWTPRGKVRLFREHEKTELTCWWSDARHLPKGYRILREVPA